MDAHFFSCVTQDEAEAFLTLAERSEVFAFRRLAIRGAIGEGGWAALAEALRVLPPLLLDATIQDPDLRGFQALVVGGRNLLLDGRREDLRAIWDALPIGSHLLLGSYAHAGAGVTIDKVSEEDWVRLERYLEDGRAD